MKTPRQPLTPMRRPRYPRPVPPLLQRLVSNWYKRFRKATAQDPTRHP